jgi:hypothetical protein
LHKPLVGVHKYNSRLWASILIIWVVVERIQCRSYARQLDVWSSMRITRQSRSNAPLNGIVLRVANLLLLICVWPAILGAQTGPAQQPASINLEVPKNTALQIALQSEVRVQKIGQPIVGRVVEPIFVFDKQVIPTGSQVDGQISRIRAIDRVARIKAALDADFTPARPVEVAFHSVTLPDGRVIPIETVVTPGSGEVMRFLTAPQNGRKNSAHDEASEKAREAKEQAKREWTAAMDLVTQPGRLHRFERFLIAQLPVHPQYIDAGSVYFAEIQNPLEFGSEPLTAKTAAELDRPLPPNCFVRARLLTPLNSATAHVSDPIDSVILRPLLGADGSLYLPAGAHLTGTVSQAAPARMPGRNGNLRIGFHELVMPPEWSAAQTLKIEGDLDGVQSAESGHISLDSEGGARATDPSSKYINTVVTVGLAAVSFGVGGDTLGDTTERAAGGAGGYKLIGIILGATVHSQPFGMAMGALGAARSIYIHFIARGRDVVFPKNTSMEIALGTHR